MKYIAVLAFMCVSLHHAHGAPSDKVDCSKLDEVMDDLSGAQALTTLNDKYKLATNSEEWAKRCTEIVDSLKTLRKYNKECFSSLTNQVFSAILRTRAAVQDERCKTGSPSFDEAVAASKCVVDNSFEGVRDAEKKTILASQVLLDSNIPDDKLRTRRACCAVLESRQNFLNATKDKCSAYQKVYEDYVDSYTSESMSLICPESSKLECDKLEKLKTDGVALKYNFFLHPMIKVVKTLDH